MPKELSLAEIQASFSEQWLLIGEPRLNEVLQLLGGQVLCHSQDRDEVFRFLVAHRVRRFVLIYAGSNPSGQELALLDRACDAPTADLPAGRVPWGGLMGWLVALVVAGLVYGGTADPSLGVAAACVRAGWNELWSGWWLYRSDPLRRRAQACFWFYLASSLWKIWAFAVTAMMVCVALRPPQVFPVPREFVVAATTMAIALGLTVLAGCIAIPFGLRCRVKVWVEPRIGGKCAGDFSQVPYIAWHLRGGNYGVLLVVALSLVLPAIVLSLIGLCVVLPLENGQQMNMLASLAMAGLLWLPILTIPAMAWVLRRIRATHPAECWPLGVIAFERIVPIAYAPGHS